MHLGQQVDELSRTLQGNMERLAICEWRSSAVNDAGHHIGTQGGSRENQLQVEVADLRQVSMSHNVVIVCPTHSHMFLVLHSK
jgi:hypothetical protein